VRPALLEKLILIVLLFLEEKNKTGSTRANSKNACCRHIPDIDFTRSYFKIGFWDGLSPVRGGGLFF
jgi:hypothetical protein